MVEIKGNPKQFVDNSFKKTIKKANKITKDIILTTYSHLVVTSPVYSGRYKRSHQFSINDKEKYSKTFKGTEDKIKQTNFNVIKDKNYMLSNNVDYAERLEAGYSKKAPNGIYLPTFNKMKVYIKKKLNQFEKEIIK